MICSKIWKITTQLFAKFSNFNRRNLLVKTECFEVPEASDIEPSTLDQKTSSDVEDIIWIESTDVYQPFEVEYTSFTQQYSLPPYFSSIYIADSAVNSLLRHLSSHLTVEQGGVLFGHAYKDSEFGIYTEIEAAIAAPATISTETSFKLTPDSWDGILKNAKKLSSKTTIVGWYHSHPNLGVFMSATDMKTQQACFSHPWSVSIVCDPVRKEIGYFQGSQARPVTPLIFCSWLRR